MYFGFFLRDGCPKLSPLRLALTQPTATMSRRRSAREVKEVEGRRVFCSTLPLKNGQQMAIDGNNTMLFGFCVWIPALLYVLVAF